MFCMFLPVLVYYLKHYSMGYKPPVSLEVTMCLPPLRESFGLAAVVYNQLLPSTAKPKYFPWSQIPWVSLAYLATQLKVKMPQMDVQACQTASLQRVIKWKKSVPTSMDNLEGKKPKSKQDIKVRYKWKLKIRKALTWVVWRDIVWDKNKVICVTRGVLATGTGGVLRHLKIVRRTQWRGRQIFFLNMLHVRQRLEVGGLEKRKEKTHHKSSD